MFKLEIETENAAFEDDAAPEVIRCLKKLIKHLEHVGITRPDEGVIMDVNGNKVGSFTFTD